MSRMASPGSLLPGGFSLGRLSHADRVGLVYRARPTDASDSRSACALVLHPLHVEELRDWFERMAVLGRSLRHPNLVEVYALGYTSNDLPVVVTEWVEGRTLRAELAAGRVFNGAECIKILREVCAALTYLHSRTPPVLHRVLMPETVMVTVPNGVVKVLGVGHADRPHHPASKPASLSPEELMNEPLSIASDVYSLATFAYELLSGRPAFAGGTMQVLTAMRRGVFPTITALTSEAAAPIDAVLRRAWSFDPAERHPSADAFFQDFEDAVLRVPGPVLAMRRIASDFPSRFSSAPPMLPGSAGLRPGVTPLMSSRPPGTRAAAVEVVRGPSLPPSSRYPAPGSAVNPGVRESVPRPPRAPTDLVVPKLSAGDVDASALLPFATTRDETTVRVSRDEVERHGPIDVGDAFVSLGSGVIDDPEVIAVIAREKESEREAQRAEAATDRPREAVEVARPSPPALGEDVTDAFTPLARRKGATDSKTDADSARTSVESSEAPMNLSIPRAPAAPDARSLGMGGGRSFEDWAPKIPDRKSTSWYKREVAFTLPTIVVLLVLHAMLTAILVQTLAVIWSPHGHGAVPAASAQPDTQDTATSP